MSSSGMNDPFDARSDSSWPIITSGARTSRWTKMRRSRGLHNRQPAAPSFKYHTSAACSTITNGAPPDHRSLLLPDRDVLTRRPPAVHRGCPRRCQLASPDIGAACRKTLIAGSRRLLRAPTEFLVGTGKCGMSVQTAPHARCGSSLVVNRLAKFSKWNALAFAQRSTCLGDATEEFRVMLQTILEPVVFRRKPY